MKLVGFSVTNYRSITAANRLQIGQKTILIGPNNEGKSNLLQALSTSMSLIEAFAHPTSAVGAVHMRRVYRELYNWEIDFPISLQDSKPNGKSTFRLEFDLTGREVEEFRRDIKSNLNGTLPIELRIGQREEPTFKVLKRGPGGPALSGKANRIARYLGSRIDFNYIPTIRTAEAASEVVARMVGRRLAALEHDDSYKTAIEKIRELQEPILKQLSNEVTETLRQFLPEVHSVSVEVSEQTRIRSCRRDCEITVDDGTATLLERKGDGVKSLAAISLLYGSSPTESASILALEEPESHLHPKAIHKLREVLDDLSSNVQLVITTHNPLFVDRTQLKNNVLVSDRRAKSARSVAEVRELLGVRAADNLAHARFVLVVEGRGDRDCVGALFRARSKSVTAALDSNDRWRVLVSSITSSVCFRLHSASFTCFWIMMIADGMPITLP